MRIRQLILHTLHPEKLMDFYGRVLHLPVREARGQLEVSCGDTRLIFRPGDPEAYYHYAFNIPHGQIEEALQWLRSTDLPVLHEGRSPITEFPNWNARSLYFRDPAGNVLEFIARRDLQLKVVKPFSPRTAIRAVSEIGLPVQNVPAAAEAISKHTGIPPYWGTGPAFRALGDPEGLLILVAETEKTWYPTRVPARPFPVEVVTDEGRLIRWSRRSGLTATG